MHEINTNGEHFYLAAAATTTTINEYKHTLIQSGSDEEIRIFPLGDRNSVDRPSKMPAIAVRRRQRRSATKRKDDDEEVVVEIENGDSNNNDDDEKLKTEGSGFDSNVLLNGFTVDYEKENVENNGNSWDNPIPLNVNNVRYQFDESDTNDGISDVESQRRKFDVSNLMLHDIEPMAAAAAAAATPTEMTTTTAAVASQVSDTAKLENESFQANNFHVTNVDGNENDNSSDSSATKDDFNESFELITDSIHETLVSENVVNDSHQVNDVIYAQSQTSPMPSLPSPSKLSSSKLDQDDLNWTSSDNLMPKPLITDRESDKNDSANGMKFDETFDDNIDHKPDDNDSTLQNDSPAIIVQYDKQPILKINHLDTDSTNDEVDEHTHSFQERQRNDNSSNSISNGNENTNASANMNENANDNENVNVNENVGSILNTKHAAKQTDKPPHSNANSIDGNEYVETLSGIKHQEPRYEMLDMVHNDSIKARDVSQNMQRILVNVSIGTDSGDGTQNHGIYMLHVSVPAGPNLSPAHFDGDSPQTAIHAPPKFIRPTQSKDDNKDDNDNTSNVGALAVSIPPNPQAPSPMPPQWQQQQHLQQTVERDPDEMSSVARKSAELLLEYSSEIARLNSIIANLNKTIECKNSYESQALTAELLPSSSSSSSPSPSNLSYLQGNESLIVSKTDGKAENENETLTTTKPTATTVPDYNENDNRINNNNFGLCNQDIPPILILEGKRFAYTHPIVFTSWKIHFRISCSLSIYLSLLPLHSLSSYFYHIKSIQIRQT